MNFMFIRARYNYIQLIILQRIEGKARFLYSLPFPPSSNGMKWYAMILILIAIPADANFLNGYALNGPVLVGYVLKIRIGGICIGGIRLRFLLMHTFWMDTHWMDTHSMDTYWWDTCWTDTYWWDTYCKTCWCKRFERITLHAYVLVGYVLNGYVLVGYVLVGYVLNGYVWDMCGVMDMCGICVVWDMCGICVVWDMCGICVAWDMCGICVVWDTPTIFWRTLRRNVFPEKRMVWKRYCWWKKSCTSWYGKCPIIYRVLYIPDGAGFLPSTVSFQLQRILFKKIAVILGILESWMSNFPWFPKPSGTNLPWSGASAVGWCHLQSLVLVTNAQWPC